MVKRTIPPQIPCGLLCLCWLLCFFTASPALAGPADDLETVLEAAATYRFGDSRAPLLEMEKWVAAASKDSRLRRDLAKGMADRLGSDAATLDAKRFFCRQLGLVGSGAEVPALAALFTAEPLWEDARSALEMIPGEASLAALRALLPRARNERLAGLINALGERRDADSVEDIAAHLISARRDVFQAAVYALGRIGGEEAAEHLAKVMEGVPPGIDPEVSHALLACARRCLEEGKRSEGAKLFHRLMENTHPPAVRAAALRGLADSLSAMQQAELLKLALTNEESLLRHAALGYVQDRADPEMITALSENLPVFPDDIQEHFLMILLERHQAERDLLNRTLKKARDRRIRYRVLLALFELEKDRLENVALDAAASSPDDLDRDGGAGGDEDAVDGDPETYWDEVDGQPLYRYCLSFDAPRTVSALCLTAWAHHDYAPKDFEILLDGRVVRTVRNAAYHRNRLLVGVPRMPCKSLELRIAGYYGQSPAIRELEVYDAGDLKVTDYEPLPAGGDDPWGPPVPSGEYRKIREAAPEEGQVRPRQKRRLLVFSRSHGYQHSAIPYGKAAIEVLAGKTGAFSATFTDDAAFFEQESLDGFDAVFFNNTNNEIFLPEDYDKLAPEEKAKADETDARLKKNLVAFLKRGGGLAVLHAGVASFRNWPEFGEIMSARFDNHPWNAGSRVMLKVDDPDHPVSRAFKDHPHLEISDEFYQLKGSCDRDRVRVLVSLDMERTAVTEAQQKLIHREDGDFAMSYVKSYGAGRIFYCAFGHQHELFWNPIVLEHCLDGIQFVLGDLEGDTTPSSMVSKKGADAGRSFSWRRSEDRVALLNGDRVVWQLNFDEELQKAYFHPVGLQDGTPLTWFSPPDHRWHRGLWFSWKFIDGVNYWEYVPGMGESGLLDRSVRLGDDFSASITVELDYHPPGGEPVLREHRRIEVSPPDPEGSYFIDWDCTFTAVGGDHVLDRTPPPGAPDGKSWGGYSGMSVRLAEETADWRITDSEGRTGTDCHRKPARWVGCDFTHTAAGREAGVAILDHPENLRHPPPIFIVLNEEIPFVYFSPAPLFEAPFTLGAGASLPLRFRILVHPGRKGKEALEEAWKRFAGE